MTNKTIFHSSYNEIDYRECEKGIAMEETCNDMNNCMGYIRMVFINLYNKCIINYILSNNIIK